MSQNWGLNKQKNDEQWGKDAGSWLQNPTWMGRCFLSVHPVAIFMGVKPQGDSPN